MRNNILKYLKRSSLDYPENTCISDSSHSLTYAESTAKSYAISLQLRETGKFKQADCRVCEKICKRTVHDLFCDNGWRNLLSSRH